MKKRNWGVGILLMALLAWYVIPLSSEKEGKAMVKPINGELVGVDDTVRINIQPLDGVKNVEKDVEKFMELYLKPLDFKHLKLNILPHKNSPDSALNYVRTRYRATKLMNFLHDNTPKREFTIGITDKDISTTIHGADDYGILGISSLGHRKRACITSTYRLKNKSDLWKLMAHEFTHGFFSLGHCKSDDEQCIMRDAKGKSPRFDIKEKLCDRCQSELSQAR